MHHYQIDMAGIRWDVRSPMVLQEEEKCIPFRTCFSDPDIRLWYRFGLPEKKGRVCWERTPKVWADNHGFWVERTQAVRGNPGSCIYLDLDNPTLVEGWIYPEHEEDFQTLESLLDVSELEILLTLFNGVSLHSSFIRWKERGILFSAPSGTGKSTQANLWEFYRKAEILNGDRSMIRKLDTGWTAFGSPFAGSSSIYRNESAPVGVIVVLRQAKENAVEKLNEAEAFRYLYSEMVIPKWHMEAHQKIISLTEALAKEVPVLLFQCTPDENAVSTLEQFLENEQIITSGRIE